MIDRSWRDNYDKTFNQTLDGLIASCRKRDRDPEFQAAFNCVPATLRKKRSFTRIAMESLVDAYAYLVQEFPEAHKLVDDFQRRLSDKAEISLPKRKAAPAYSALDDAPEFIRIFKDHPVNMCDITDEWVQTLRCLGASMHSDAALTIEGRTNCYLRETGKQVSRYLYPEGNKLSRQLKNPELKVLAQQAEEAQLPPTLWAKIERNLKRLDNIAPFENEYRDLLKPTRWLVSFPIKASPVVSDVAQIETQLGTQLTGLEKTKERILEHLAMVNRKPGHHGPALCLRSDGLGVAPVAEALARATGREFVQISLRGMTDATEISGHHHIDNHSLPGLILQAIQKSGTCNPLVFIDHLHRANDHISDEIFLAIDPVQNKRFRDEYLGTEFDMSDVMFVCSSSDSNKVNSRLWDNMNHVYIPRYTHAEKIGLVQNYLLPQQLKKNGLLTDELTITCEMIDTLIRSHTKEKGIVDLEWSLDRLCRHAAYEIESGRTRQVEVTPEYMNKVLGPPLTLEWQAAAQPKKGTVFGLYVNNSGGGLLKLEAVKFPNRGFSISLTGNLASIMEESVVYASKLIRSQAATLNISSEELEKTGVHVHAADAATSKNGPSAGIAMTTAIISALTGKKVRQDLAMTGEVSLLGDVLKIGGLADKLEGAVQAGIKTVIIPESNTADLDSIDPAVKGALEIIPVTRIERVLSLAFNEPQLSLNSDDEENAAPATSGEVKPFPRTVHGQGQSPS